MARKTAVDPTSTPDPRFDPASDDQNAAAHGEKPKRKAKGSARKTEVQTLVRRSLERAIQHFEERLEPDLTEATDYYHGRPFGDEEEGRSQVVSTDVRDATLAQLPSLLRIFFGRERAVEFRPEGPEDEEIARQATDYVNYVIRNDNAGFLTFHSWLKDGLTRRLGWVKWWWDTTSRVRVTKYTGLDDSALLLLTKDLDVADWEITGRSGDEMGETFDVRVTRRYEKGCPRFAAVPSEEVVFTSDARSVDDAACIAHARYERADVLLGMGIPKALVEANKGKRRKSEGQMLDDARHIDDVDWQEAEDQLARDPSQQEVWFAEAYMLVDGDGDDTGELRLFQCVGPDHEIANGDGLGEVVDEIPLAPWTPEPEPHTLVGLSNWDLLKDVQRVKSQAQREMLNSLARSVDPPLEVVEGEVNMTDVLSKEASKIIRVRKPGMLREVDHLFNGPNVLPVLDYYDQIKEARTGHTKAAAGLDADSLQSSTKAAVAATISASQQRIEMIARVFAETGLTRLMKGLLGLIVKHQDRERMVRLRGKFVPIDPRHWDAGMDVQVNVGLGQGTPEDRIAMIGQVVAVQQQAKELGAPFVGFAHMRAALAKAVEAMGFDPDQFFAPWGPEQDAMMQQQMAAQGPPQDPNMALVQVEAMKAQSEMEIQQQKLALEQWKARMEDDRERDKIAREAVLKERELELKHAADIRDAELQAQVATQRAQMDADLKREQAAQAPAQEAA